MAKRQVNYLQPCPQSILEDPEAVSRARRKGATKVCLLPLPLPLLPLSISGSCFISRAAKTENPVPRSFFAPKPNGNACYAG